MKKTITEKAVIKFEKHLEQNEKSRATIDKYSRDVRAFLSRCCGDGITKDDVILYKKMLIESGFAARSINSMIASLCSFFSFVGRDDLKVKPIKIQNEIYRPEEKELTKSEFIRLCKAAENAKNNRLLLILQTICGTGIRVSELEYVTCDAVRRGVASVRCKGKTRDVFLVRDLQKKLLRYAAEQNIKSGCIFITRTGKPVNRSNIWREMKALCADACVSPTKVFPHNLRHLFARVFYGIDKDIAKLADILGHASINTTRIYIISTGTEHRRRMENMHLIM